MGDKLIRILSGFLAVIMVLIVAFPFVVMLSTSLQTKSEIFSPSASLLPEKFMFSNYAEAMKSGDWLRYFANSAFITAIVVVISLIINSMAGYSLSCLSFPGQNRIYHGLLLLMMIPGQVLLIPNYLLLKEFGMLDSFTALILPAAANIGNIFLMRQFFMNFPRDVIEAAEIDGLGRYGVFFRIAMPLARPTIATTAIFGFMGFWNEFTKPMLYLKTQTKYTLTLGLQSFQSQNAGTMWNQVMAAACISVVPIILLYLIFNKFFLVGVRMDGEK